MTTGLSRTWKYNEFFGRDLHWSMRELGVWYHSISEFNSRYATGTLAIL